MRSLTDLTYPAFPKRAFLAAGAVLLALMAVAVMVNKSTPTVHGCAVAAERVMAARNYSARQMGLLGPGSVRACRGLTVGQFDQALLDTYQIEYGRHLPKASITYAEPPPAFKTISAQAKSRSP